ncbi:hypothetical protein LCGC14_1226010 [marine sediment metagenome]|uniref:Uncharacterized protein n=1 Tax=marine sediment metagenome TaxID=412755 RepID=A0A0F9LX23_9ZZZZ
MSWPEDRPEGRDFVSDFGPVIHSHKTEFRAGLEKHFYWTDSSNASAGESRLTIGLTVTGSCRAFYDTESRVSAFRDGALLVTSDTTRLYGLTSGSSFLLGSARAVHNPTTGPVGSLRQLVQSDEVGTAHTDGSFNFTFPVEYSIAPALMITAKYPSGNRDGRVGISTVTAGGFTGVIEGTVGSGVGIWWRSSGTVAI